MDISGQICVGCSGGEVVSEDVVGALLVLIPKLKKLETMRNFRPISLCNTCTKLITKVIANQIKSILDVIISPHQATFIPGRQAADNVVICHEIIHSLRHTTSRRGGMVVKIDLEKAYDRLECNFVEETLKDACLPSSMIDVITGRLCQSHCRLI